MSLMISPGAAPPSAAFSMRSNTAAQEGSPDTPHTEAAARTAASRRLSSSSFSDSMNLTACFPGLHHIPSGPSLSHPGAMSQSSAV